MKLTDEERRMLDGEYGEGVMEAMKMLVAIGNAYQAERLIDITRTHVALSNQEADLYYAEKLLNKGASCKIEPTTNPGWNTESLGDMPGVTGEDISTMKKTNRVYKELGAKLTFNCTPYLEANVPRFGEHVAYSESSATPYVNSVLGARTNREAAQSALASAITGKTPEYGLHFDKNRKGTVEVNVKAELRNEYDYGKLGLYLGKEIGKEVPVFTGLSHDPSPEELTSLGAMLNTSGAVPMFHVVGVTPEAPTKDVAFAGTTPKEIIPVAREDFEDSDENLTTASGKIDYVFFGCPHYTINQVKDVATQLEGEKLPQGTSLWITTSSLTKELAERMGFLEIIRNAGGELVSDTCPDQPCWKAFEDKVGITDSLKWAYYSVRRDHDYIAQSRKKCIEYALKGGFE